MRNNIKQKIACLTIDFERDYGSRVDRSSCYLEKGQIAKIATILEKHKVRVSGFIQTGIAQDSKVRDIIKILAADLHCHSHSHCAKNSEIRKSCKEFYKTFGKRPLGYRAPFGRIGKNFSRAVKGAGFKFSSSVFPSYRPRKYNNLQAPTQPYKYKNKLWEIPLAVIPTVRYTISLSYLKLIGIGLFKTLVFLFGLPNILVFDMHLHDLIIAPKSYKKLPFLVRTLYRVNMRNGPRYLDEFIKLLKKRGYRFMTMTELYEFLEKKQ